MGYNGKGYFLKGGFDMFCPECGTKNLDEAKFCENCGTKLEVQPVQESQVEATQEVKEETSNEVQSNVQDDNVQNVTQQANTQVVQPTQPIPAKPLSKGVKAAIIGVVVGVIAIIAFVTVCKKKFSPENIAIGYFEDVAAANWDEVYDYYDLSEDDFVNKQMYKKSVKDKKKIEYTNYAVKQTTQNMEEILENASKRENNNENGIYKTVNIEYAVKNSDETNSVYTVKLVKLKGKKLLFFDNWKVIPDDMLSKNYTISTLKGVDVYLDGKKLSDKYLKKDKDGYDDNLAVYDIEAVFAGTHQIEFKADFIDTFKEDIIVSTGSIDTYSYTRLEIKEEFMDELKKNTEKLVDSLYQAAIEDKKLTDIKLDYDLYDDNKETIEDAYDDLCENVDKTSYSSQIMLKSFEKQNFEITDDNSYVDSGAISATISYKINYKGEFVKKKGDKEEKKKDDCDTRGTVSFKYIDGKWYISRISVANIYYFWI